MSTLSREKIALIVFFVLIILGIAALVGYLTLGHSWNYAATTIDDAAGTMDGYTVIVFEGTEQERKSDPKLSASLSTDTVLAPEIKEDSAPSGTSKHHSSDIFRPPNRADRTNLEPSEILSADLPYQLFLIDPHDFEGEEENETKETVDQDEDPAYLAPLSGDFIHPKTKVDIDDVVESYEVKNAIVFVVDSENPEKYQEGLILKKGSHRFGVFYVDDNMKRSEIRKQVSYFKSHKVDFIVALAEPTKKVAKVAGIDIVISPGDNALISSGETMYGTFCVPTPTQGSVGVIMISPSNVVSAKVLSESE